MLMRAFERGHQAEEALDKGDDVVIVLRHRMVASHSGIELQDRFAQVWTFRDGKVVRYRGFPTKDEALADLGQDREN